MHPFLRQEKLLKLCKRENIAVTAFSPLGSLSYVGLGMAGENDSLLRHEVVTPIATKHGKTPAQVLLRWGVQRETSVITRSTKVERLEENFAIYDFELDDADMAVISALDCHRRFNDPGAFCEGAFGHFNPIYD